VIDTIVEGSAIYDGRSHAPLTTDLAIVGDRIALIGDLAERESIVRIDGRGKALAPGFIDVHSHTDELWLVDGRCSSKVLQGVTTEIAGNCGSSVAPLHGLARARRADDLSVYGLEIGWTTLDEFYALVQRGGVSLNVASLVGLGTTRRCVRGDLEGRLDDFELHEEAALVREAIDHGALGISSGLIYTPSRWADVDELSAMSAVARAGGGGIYATHLRNEGNELLDAVAEALEVGRRAEVAVQFSHHKAMFKRNWGKVHRSLEAIEAARRRGAVAFADVYPYVAAWTDLSTILPEDTMFGGREAALERLADPKTATAIALRLELDWGDSWHDIMIADVRSERNAAINGMRIDGIAAQWGTTPVRAAIRLLREERLDAQAIFFVMSEDDVASVISAGFTCIGSDASARAVDGPTARGVPHPRAYGTFPRTIGRFVRRRATLELPEAIRRMSSLPAEIFGLAGRGSISVGNYADLVLFDAETIADTATYERPMSYPNGIDAVWVNGTQVASGGAHTGARPGRVLRGGA
jgi:N-acyl-D-amino-acid deacylase